MIAPSFVIELTLDTCAYLLATFYYYFIFFFKSGFTPCVDIVNKILAIQTIVQVVGIKLTTLIRHESENHD